MPPAQRLVVVRVAAALSMLAQLTMNVSLWRDRSLPGEAPSIPLVSWLPPLPEPGGLLLWISMLGAIALLVVGRAVRPAAIYLAVAYVVMSVFDQLRLEPYNTVCIVLLLLATSVQPTPRDALRAVRFAIAGLYFFAGLGKLNMLYALLVHPDMLAPLVALMPDVLAPALEFPWTVPVYEMVMGIVVVAPGPWRTRRFVLAGALAMHTFIITMLLVASHDPTVLPFNGVVAICAAAVLWDRDEADGRIRLRDITRSFGGGLALAYGLVVPIISWIGFADANLSHNVYSGTEARIRWYATPDALARLDASWPEPVRQHVGKPPRVPDGAEPPPAWLVDVPIHGWFYRAMVQSMNAEARNADAVKRVLCDKVAQAPTDVMVRFYTAAHPITGRRLYRDAFCDQDLGFWVRMGGVAPFVIGGDGPVRVLEPAGDPTF